jgi:hypothetical protein
VPGLAGALPELPESLVAGVLDPLLAVLDALLVEVGFVADVVGKAELELVGSVLLFAAPELVLNGALTVPAATCGSKWPEPPLQPAIPKRLTINSAFGSAPERNGSRLNKHCFLATVDPPAREIHQIPSGLYCTLVQKRVGCSTYTRLVVFWR